ncbi:MAG: hypothetical protein AUK48_04820 [Oscillatoriales cyanobacterium CG2_30_44_21]|nr:MAG: hypothetical protein AUK48_04820 [Oscillatoriales cyanobacterium CG2_30_44_21]
MTDVGNFKDIFLISFTNLRPSYSKISVAALCATIHLSQTQKNFRASPLRGDALKFMGLSAKSYTLNKKASDTRML